MIFISVFFVIFFSSLGRCNILYCEGRVRSRTKGDGHLPFSMIFCFVFGNAFVQSFSPKRAMRFRGR